MCRHAARLLYLILGHYSVSADIMADTDRFKTNGEISYYTKVFTYPNGIVDILCSSSPVFRESGWEAADRWADPPRRESAAGKRARQGAQAQQSPEDMERSKRRARARVRRLALANDFRWFVTLTLSKEKVDRYDPAEVVRKLNQWCSNQVKRRGLRYILVPERHKDGAIHFHGFFSDALDAVPSGHKDRRGHMIYNLPGWTLGFTAAIEVYGDYAGAVAYCCKYIGKQGDKPAGRWYYSGGDLREPGVAFGEVTIGELREQFGDRVFEFQIPGARMAVCNGIRSEGGQENGGKEDGRESEMVGLYEDILQALRETGLPEGAGAR